MKSSEKISLEELNRMREERQIKVQGGITLLYSIIGRYPLNEFLMLLAALNWPGNNASRYLDSKIGDNKSTGLMFQIYIPALAKFAIINSSDFVGIPDFPFDKAFDDVTKCITIINDIKDYIPFEFSNDFDFAFSAFFFQLANQQHRFQGNVLLMNNTIARSFILYRDLPIQKYSFLKIESIFEEIYGLNQSKFFIISAKLLGIQQKNWFNFDNFSGLNRMTNNLSINDLYTYFEKLSLDYDGFRKEAKNPNKSFTGNSTQFYGYSPFDSYPILNREEKFLIISHHYLIWRVYLPVYFDLLKYFTEKEETENNSFSTNFGLIFQDYVGIQLNQLNDGSKILDEIKYGKSNKDFTDLSLLYTKQKSALLIEVKKHLIPLKAKYLIDKEILHKTLIDTINKGLKQIYSKIEAINSKEKGLECFESYKSFFPIIITFDESYLLNNYFIRSIIDKELLKQGINFHNNWQIITIRELEQIVSSCNNDKSFSYLIELKVNDDKFIYLDWDKFLIDVGVKIKTNEYLQNIIIKELEG